VSEPVDHEDETRVAAPTTGVRASDVPVVGIVMGSDSDLGTMHDAVEVLTDFDIPHEVGVVSAHRDAHRMLEYGTSAAERGLRVLIAGAGGAAHLPGMLASVTSLPVIGVPVPLRHLDGLDSLLSIVQMPAGIPVATVAVGGAKNAGLLAVRILATADEGLRQALDEHRAELVEESREKDERVQHRLAGEADGFGFGPPSGTA
jgi:5-(carboxyamino)imidazole ribonucleotide mutase